jgi:hypothetical protein
MWGGSFIEVKTPPNRLESLHVILARDDSKLCEGTYMGGPTRKKACLCRLTWVRLCVSCDKGCSQPCMDEEMVTLSQEEIVTCYKAMNALFLGRKWEDREFLSS